MKAEKVIALSVMSLCQLNLNYILQGAIEVGKHADIFVWEPNTDFDLNDDLPIYIKHPVCRLNSLYSFFDRLDSIISD